MDRAAAGREATGEQSDPASMGARWVARLVAGPRHGRLDVNRVGRPHGVERQAQRLCCHLLLAPQSLLAHLTLPLLSPCFLVLLKLLELVLVVHDLDRGGDGAER